MSSRNIGDLERNKFWQPNTDVNILAIQQVATHHFSLAENSQSDFAHVNKFGRVLGYSTSMVDITDLATPAVYSWLTSAVKLEAISSSANDTAGGTGARTITVQGLDANFLEIEEDITMNGLSATTATTQEFIRVHRAYVKTSGTYATTSTGSHIGNITIRVESAGAAQIYLSITEAPVGQSLVARYTIPANKTGYLYHASFSPDGSKPSDFYIWQRQNADTLTAPYSPKRLIETFPGIDTYIERGWDVPVKLPAKTDIWTSVIGAGAGSSASSTFDLILTVDS